MWLVVPCIRNRGESPISWLTLNVDLIVLHSEHELNVGVVRGGGGGGGQGNLTPDHWEIWMNRTRDQVLYCTQET